MTIKNNFLKNLPKTKYLELAYFKEEKTQKFTTLVLTLVAFSFFGFFAINPTLSTIAKLQKELADNQFVNKKLDDKIKNLSMLQQRYTYLKNDFQIVFAAIPQSPTVSFAASQIQGVAKESNINIKRLEVFQVDLSKTETPSSANIELPNNYSYFVFSLGANGSYENISNFIFSLVNFERIITIDSLSISAIITKESSNEKTLQLNLRGKIYFKK